MLSLQASTTILLTSGTRTIHSRWNVKSEATLSGKISTSQQREMTNSRQERGTKTERKEVIVAHRGWVIALCIASILLIILCLVSSFVHYFLATGVDIAMNFSSLATRNNPHILLPNTGTFLDASDRAKLLSNLRLRFGDTESERHVGNLAIDSFSTDKASVISRVQKGRLYK